MELLLWTLVFFPIFIAIVIFYLFMAHSGDLNDCEIIYYDEDDEEY